MSNRKSSNDPASVAMRSAATAIKAGEAFSAAASVIAARSSLGGLTYAQAGEEASLMVTEKVAAFSEAGAAVTAGATEFAGRSARFAAEEAQAATRGLAEVAACRTPMELFQVQSRLMTDFLGRSLTFNLGVNALAAKVGERALHPIHKAVVANDLRLKKK